MRVRLRLLIEDLADTHLSLPCVAHGQNLLARWVALFPRGRRSRVEIELFGRTV